MLIQRDTRLASKAAAIRLSTIECPSTISMTMMKAVTGACVTAARNAVMPMAIMTAAPSVVCVSCAMSLPMPAPMASDGAKMPPGTPDQTASQVAMMRSVT